MDIKKIMEKMEYARGYSIHGTIGESSYQRIYETHAWKQFREQIGITGTAKTDDVNARLAQML